MVTAGRQYGAVPGSIPLARDFVRLVLADLPRDVTERTALVATELVAQAVHGSGSAGFTILVSIEDCVRVEVADTGRGAAPGGRQSPDMASLTMVNRLADRWGVIWSDPGPGKTIWVELDHPPQPS